MQKVIVIGGPTASGKTGLAINLAKNLLAQDCPAVIINADSMQVYKEIPILTAQPTEKERENIPHVLYGIIPASTVCSAGLWAEMAREEILKAWKKGLQPILVGGTGLYIKTLIHGIAETPETDQDVRNRANNLLKEIGNEAFYKIICEIDPESAAKLTSGNSQRLLRVWEIYEQTGTPLSEWQKRQNKTYFDDPSIFSGYFLAPPRPQVYENANKRFLKMINDGMLEEVRLVMSKNLPSHYPSMKSHGMPELIKYIKGEITLGVAVEKAQQNTRNYVKRQFTWFNNQLPEFNRIINLSDIIL